VKFVIVYEGSDTLERRAELAAKKVANVWLLRGHDLSDLFVRDENGENRYSSEGQKIFDNLYKDWSYA
jgi:hypothetical protein